MDMNNKKEIEILLTGYYKSIDKNVRETTIRSHVNRLKVLSKLDLDLSDTYDVIKKIEKKYPKSISSITTSISSILIYIQATGENMETVKEYRNYLFNRTMECRSNLKEKLNTPQKPLITKYRINKIRKGFISDIVKINFNDIKISDKILLQNYLIFSLYSGLQPVARSDYNDMLITPFTGGCDKSMNYYDKNQKMFVFCSYKTSNKKGVTKVPVVKKIRDIIDRYHKYISDSEYLLMSIRPNNKYVRMTKSVVNKRVKQIFGIGICKLRSWYISEQLAGFKKLEKKMEKISEGMMNTPDTIKNCYLMTLK